MNDDKTDLSVLQFSAPSPPSILLSDTAGAAELRYDEAELEYEDRRFERMLERCREDEWDDY